MDPRIDKLAELLVDYSVGVRPGDRVLIDGDTMAAPLLRAVYGRVLRAGGHPLMQLSLDGLDELLFRLADDEQLRYVHEPVRQALETYDVRIAICADANTKALSGVDPTRMVLREQSRADLTKTFLRRSASGELRWVLSLFPTNAYAQDAEMSLAEYEDFVYGACMPDPFDPVGYWKRVSARQESVVEWLRGKQSVEVRGPGTDLRLNITGRNFVNCDCHQNVPDGEVFTGPVEDSMEGTVNFSYPALYSGREVTGVRLWFERGVVVKATAEKNEAFLLSTLETDAGARRVGEFAIGTNEAITRFTGQILFDEKIGGSFHLALGAGYPETGSRNESAIHWDMICDLRDGGEIRVDGELLYRNGAFVIDL